MNPKDARVFLASLTTTAPAKRYLSRWEQLQIEHNTVADADAVHLAAKVRDRLVSEHPAVFARKDGTR